MPQCHLSIGDCPCAVYRAPCDGGVPAVRGVGWSAGHRRAMMSMWLVGEHGGSMAGWRPGEFETSVVRYRHVPPEYTAPRHEPCLEPKTIVQTSRSLLTITEHAAHTISRRFTTMASIALATGHKCVTRSSHLHVRVTHRAQVRNPDLDEGAKNQVRVRHRAQVRNPVFTPLSPG